MICISIIDNQNSSVQQFQKCPRCNLCIHKNYCVYCTMHVECLLFTWGIIIYVYYCGNYDIIGNLIIYVYIKQCFIVFIQLITGLCLPIVLSLVYGTCVYFAYNKVTTIILMNLKLILNYNYIESTVYHYCFTGYRKG